MPYYIRILPAGSQVYVAFQMSWTEWVSFPAKFSTEFGINIDLCKDKMIGSNAGLITYNTLDYKGYRISFMLDDLIKVEKS